jgi:acyl carrier protein
MIQKTSSGKIQRRACRAALAAGELPVLYRADEHVPVVGVIELDLEDRASVPARVETSSFFSELFADMRGQELTRALLAREGAERSALLEEFVRWQIARALSIDAAQILSDRPLAQLGLDSLRAVEIGHQVQEELGIRLPATAMLKHETLAALTAFLLEKWLWAVACDPAAGPANTAALTELEV